MVVPVPRNTRDNSRHRLAVEHAAGAVGEELVEQWYSGRSRLFHAGDRQVRPYDPEEVLLSSRREVAPVLVGLVGRELAEEAFEPVDVGAGRSRLH